VRAILVIAVLALPGCCATLEESRTAAIAQHRSMVTLGAAVPARDQRHCDAIDSDHTLFIRGAWVNGLVAGGAGTAAGFIQGTNETSRDVRIGLGITAAVTASLAAASAGYAAKSAADWASECGSGP
jgi:hypothetical protein